MLSSYSNTQVVLQTRLFAYGSAARYRLGINFHQLEVNKVKHKYAYNPTKRDGAGYVNDLEPRLQPNYIADDGGSSFAAKDADNWTGDVTSYESRADPDDYTQPLELWIDFINEGSDKNFVSNVATNLSTASEEVKRNTLGKTDHLNELFKC